MTEFGESMRPLSDMEIDVIGEVMNISMGAAATAVSTILDKKVTITTPRIETVSVNDFDIAYLEPAVGVLIKYIEGIEGNNILLLKQADIKNILCHLLSTDPDEEFVLDEISTSAVCEIMNQMMGSASSALASFLGHVVNISPPEVLDVADIGSVKGMFALKGQELVSIKFRLVIDDLVDSEFISALEPDLARKIVKMSLGANEVEDQAAKKASAPQKQAETARMEEPVAAAIAGLTARPEPYYNPEPSQKKAVETQDFNYKSFDTPAGAYDPNTNNLELIMSVPLQITVELGRTKKKIKDIIELSQGNIVELDRQAGAQVDVLANGRLIAKGDVVIVDDNYSVRITEIVRLKETLSEL